MRALCRGPKTPEIPRKRRVLRELFREVLANFCLLPCDLSPEPNRNCSENLFRWTSLFWVDFSGGLSSSDFGQTAKLALITIHALHADLGLPRSLWAKGFFGGSPKLKSEYLKMAFFSGIPLRKSSENWRVECELQSKIPFSSANFSAKSHLQMSPFQMSPFRTSWFL